MTNDEDFIEPLADETVHNYVKRLQRLKNLIHIRVQQAYDMFTPKICSRCQKEEQPYCDCHALLGVCADCSH